MTSPVTTLDTSDTMAFAEELMNVERIRHLPVVDGEVLVGLVAQRDLLAASVSTLNNLGDELDRETKRRVKVTEIMRGSIETIQPEADAIEAADFFLTQKVGCLPVVDERHRLLGIVTEADFVRVARERLSRERAGRETPSSSATSRTDAAATHREPGTARTETAATHRERGAPTRRGRGGHGGGPAPGSRR